MKYFLQMIVDIFIVITSVHFIHLSKGYFDSGDFSNMAICIVLAVSGILIAFMEWR